jgi:hypothetical protein
MKRTKRTPASRRDGSGHLNPEYEAHLLALSRAGRDRGEQAAFVDSTTNSDPGADELAYEYVESATAAQSEGQEMLDRYMPEEEGGPFVETSAQTEFATDSDAPNIEGATREPFPTT